MFVEKLEVFGFKSFSQRLELTFSNGISGVIGPNGCGKSNIVDSFRWVLGEQSSKQLRGDKMEDVIFNGTREVKPLSMAEVYLTLVNDRGLLPLEYSHVTIGRRLYRSGQSEYTINKATCRLKDIRDLFLDTGMGSHAYSVIERQMVDNVLSDNTGHRRFLFEEASGIMKYKTRKKEALTKLEATQVDLTRLSDILHEVERETESLRRQVGKAERYRELKEKLKGLELAAYFRRLSDLSHELSNLEGSGAQLSQAEAEAQGRLSASEARLAEVRLEMVTAERALTAARDELARLEADITGKNHQIVVLREREASTTQRVEAARERIGVLALRRTENESEAVKAAEALVSHESNLGIDRERLTSQDERFRELDRQFRTRREEVGRKKQLSLDLFQERLKREGDLRQCRAEREQIEAAQREVEEERNALAVRRVEVTRRRDESRGTIGDLTRRLDELTAAAAQLSDAIARLEAEGREAADAEALARQQAAGLESSLSTLEDLRRSYEGFDPGVRRVMLEHGQEPGVLGTVADLIHVPDEWVEALRPVLDPALQQVVTADRGTAKGLIETLTAAEAGYVRFLPLDRLSGRGHELMPHHPAVIGQARHFVQASPEVRPLVDYLLGDVLVVDGLASAIDLASDEAWSGWRFVTPEGALLDGVVIAGGRGGDRAGDILDRERQIDRLRAGLDEKRTEAARHERLRQEKEGDRMVAEAELESGRRAISDVITDRAGREAEIGRLEGELQVVEEREADLTLRESSHEARRRALLESLTRHEEALLAASNDSQTAEDQYHEEEMALALLEAERESAQTALNDTRVAVATREAAVSEAKERIERVKATAREIETDHERCVYEVGEGQERLVHLAAEVEQVAAQVQDLHTGRAARVEAVAERDREAADLRLRVDAAEGDVREARRAAQDLHDRAHGEELRRTELKAEWRGLELRLYEDYDQTPAELLAVPREWPLDEQNEPLAVEFVDQQVSEFKEKIKRLGPVNLLAIEEYEEKSTRLGFLRTQFEDLIKAKESLMEAIIQINSTASELFHQTFRQVQENFEKTFLVLFQGGECSLTLIGDDPLEAEIEIVARPRGKRPQSIAQLSSGERALTAIALLFAIYLVKPSPFCLLDEVDAPLDDANVDRFVAMLREFSARTQFIVITHNKKTMEACDTLYGVTMATAGISTVVSVRLNEADQLLAGQQPAARPAFVQAREGFRALVAGASAGGNGGGEPRGDEAGPPPDDRVEAAPDPDTDAGDSSRPGDTILQ